MASPARRATAATAGLLSIGQVLSRLQPDFPQLTSSKLRFLEVQGIVAPQRTASGYRKFSDDDLERLRFALTLQRDHYMPLNVIREHLEQLDAGEEPQTPIAPPSIHPTEVRYDRKELLAASGAAPQLLNDAISTGVIEAGKKYTERDARLLSTLVALDRHGIEPRHVRGLRQTAEREVALVERAMSALLRRTDATSRAKASELAPELATRLDDIRTIFVKDALGRLTD
ncbi:transcriptional regulator FtsR [Microbacterium sp. JB110]|uniref:transcriptional regulator FtsR n=1 Tax=Microbacterium sp. JB110 TaxID=2024477 RepID=UPI00097F2279|nr:MerR family transcriptional regulator [Microbacterium sp. JB110]SJM63205.1 transcriptional regulator, MerR family [Frigoribacterium sp. JB110]